MAFEITTCNDPEAWDRFVIARPLYSITHGWAWGELKGAFGWRARRYWLRRDGVVTAGAQVLCRPLPTLGGELWYAPRGYLVDYDDADTFSALSSGLAREAKTAGAVALKIEPMVPDARPLPHVAACGYRPVARGVQPRATLYLDLRADEETLLAGMERGTRYNVNLATRKGVVVRAAADRDALAVFLNLLAETTRRQHFLAHNAAYYEEMLARFATTGAILVASYEGEPLAAAFLLTFGRYAYYANAASSARRRELKAANKLVWEAIRWARGRGCEVFDFWGIPLTADPKNPLAGVYEFKKGFGGVEARFAPTYDLPLRGWRYKVLTAALNLQTAWRNLRARGTIHDPMGN